MKTCACAGTCVILVLLCLGPVEALAGDLDEYQIKRQEGFEFIEAPKITRSGDRIVIRFETKDYCDVTIAIENTRGKIVRHLASGVLGTNAPAPFQMDSKKQQILWDGKDDQDKYVDHKDSHTVRVSLGLKRASKGRCSGRRRSRPIL